jgi:hypothetical protein
LFSVVTTINLYQTVESPDNFVSTIHFRVRFWPRKPDETENLNFQTALYKQLCEDIQMGRLKVQGKYTDEIFVALGALQQQIEFGDTPGDQSISPLDLRDRVIQQHR